MGKGGARWCTQLTISRDHGSWQPLEHNEPPHRAIQGTPTCMRESREPGMEEPMRTFAHFQANMNKSKGLVEHNFVQWWTLRSLPKRQRPCLLGE
jgi:hypothetical protein